MVSNNYTNELGMNAGQKMVPLPYVIAIFAVILVGGFLGFSASLKAAHSEAKVAAVQTPSAPGR